jgi:hypothetical protein
MITRHLRLLTFHGDAEALFHDKRESETPPPGVLVVLEDGDGTKLELPLRSWEEIDVYQAAMGDTIPVTIGIDRDGYITPKG